MAMKCPKCGTENPEGKMFCGDCGTGLPQPPPPVQPMQPMYVQPKQSWIHSNWKGLVSVVVVVLVVLSVVGLVYTQPWSKIKVLVAFNGHGQIGVNIYIDGDRKAQIGLNPSSGYQIVGVWPVVAGSHEVSLDIGSWLYIQGHYDSGWIPSHWEYSPPNGVLDFSYVYEVGPLYTKNTFIQL